MEAPKIPLETEPRMKSQFVSLIAVLVFAALACSPSDSQSDAPTTAAPAAAAPAAEKPAPAAPAPVSAEPSDEPQVLFTNVNVWDGTSDSLRSDDVLVEGDLIKEVGANLRADRAQIIDGKGGTLIPGLIDSHQHIMLSKKTGPQDIINNQMPYTPAYNAIPQGMIMLMMGITTIRDVGGPSIELGKAIDAGYVDGPRIYSAGPMVSCTSGHGDFGGRAPGQGQMYPGSPAQWSSTVGFTTLADGPAEVRKATRWALAQGAAQIKIMAGGGVASLKDPLESVGFSEDEMRAAVEAAADYDTYVAAHAYNDESVQRAIRAGVKDIVHGHLLSEETIKMMAENDVWLGSLSSPYGLMDVPFFTDENRRKGRQVLDGYENVMKLAKKHGVKMGFGTDAAAQMVDTILYEFEMRCKFFTPLEMLKQATSTNAELLRFSNSRDPYKAAPLGVIEEGAWADLLIYDGNPIEDIKVVTTPEEHLKVILKGGKIYKNAL
jgi:imidazolonepropionase-like amidohydrolase